MESKQAYPQESGMVHVLVGNEAYTHYRSIRARHVNPSSHTPNTLDSESLCKFQIEASRMGFIEMELVRSNYGWSVRYASGIYNFGLFSGARGTDGSWDRAMRVALAWQQQDPARRYVTCSDYAWTTRLDL